MHWANQIQSLKKRAWPIVAASGLVSSALLATPLSAAAATSTYSSAVLADSPVAYWRLGEAAGAASVADSSGQSHTATVYPGATLGVASGLPNDTDTAASLNGSTGYLRGTDTVAVGADFTVEAWVKANSPTASGTIFSINGTGGVRTLQLNGGQFVGMTSHASTWTSYSVMAPKVDASKWHHVVYTIQGGSVLRLYVDGVAAGSKTLTNRGTFSGRPVIGWSDSTWLSKFAGSVDEVALYPTALSAVRVAAHYAASATSPAVVVPVVPADCTKTLQSHIDAAAVGSTISPPACVYRETVTINKALTLAGRPGTEIRGSDVWTAWTAANSATFVSQLAVGYLPPVSLDQYACDPNTGNRCLWSEQVFLDGNGLAQLAPGSTPVAGQFALVSTTDRRIRLGDNPSGRSVEVTTRPRWIVTKADGVTIQGLTMRHAANSAVKGAVSNDGFSNWTLQDSTLRDAHGANASLDSGSNVRLLRNDVARGGLNGIAGSGVRVGGVIQGNKINDNRTAEVAFSRNWGAGGLKLTQVTNFLVDGNEVGNNDGVGLWCDIGCTTVTISNNKVHHNRWQGINFEVSNGAKIHGNAVWENGWGKAAWGWGAGIVVSSSANAEVYNNTLAWNYAGISVIAQNRPDAIRSTGINVHDNKIIKKTVTGDFSATYWKNLSLAWLSDSTATAYLYDAASNNVGTNNHYWYDTLEATGIRFTWTINYDKLAAFSLKPGGTAGTYLTSTEMSAALTSLGMPLTAEAH